MRYACEKNAAKLSVPCWGARMKSRSSICAAIHLPEVYLPGARLHMPALLCESCNPPVIKPFAHGTLHYIFQCWCGAAPERGKNHLELDPGDCDMPCAGTTTGEHCGGSNKTLVYEITAYQGYQGCQREVSLSPAVSADEQIFGQPWDVQEKFDTANFFIPIPPTSSISNSPAGVCNV